MRGAIVDSALVEHERLAIDASTQSHKWLLGIIFFVVPCMDAAASLV